MKASHPGIGAGGFRGLMIPGLAIVAVLVFGCQANRSESDSPTLGLTSPEETEGEVPGLAPPSLDELTNHVQLNADQLQPMKDALGEWRQAAQSLAEELRVNREKGIPPGRGQVGAPAEHEPPIFPFLEESARVLKSDQFVQLAAFLAARREAHRQANTPDRSDQGRGFKDQPPQDGPFEGPMLEILADKLSLTREQQAQIRQAHAAIRQEIDALHDEYGGRSWDNPEFRQKVKKLRDSIQDRLRTILTPAQYIQLESLRQERQSHMVQKREEQVDQRRDRLAEFLGNVLAIAEPQKQQVGEILSRAHEQLAGLRESMRDSSVVAGDLREEFEKIRTEADAAIRTLLNADQARIYDALKTLLPRGGGPGMGQGRRRPGL